MRRFQNRQSNRGQGLGPGQGKQDGSGASFTKIKLDKKGIAQEARSICIKLLRKVKNPETRQEAINEYKKQVESKGLRCGCVQNYVSKNS